MSCIPPTTRDISLRGLNTDAKIQKNNDFCKCKEKILQKKRKKVRNLMEKEEIGLDRLRYS